MEDDLNSFENGRRHQFWKMEDDLNFLKMEGDLNLFGIKIKDNLILINGRQPIFFLSNGR